MNKFENLDYQLERNLALSNAIRKYNSALKDLDKTHGQDKLCWQFVEDILQILERNTDLLYKNLDQVEFEINKEKSARCKNLDEFLKMVFKHE